MYLSGHPMSAYAGLYQEGGATPAWMKSSKAPGRRGAATRMASGSRCWALSPPCGRRRRKAAPKWPLSLLEDMYGALTALVFSRPLEQYGSLLYEGSVVEVSGKLELHRGEGAGAGVPVHGQARRAYCGGGRLRQAGAAGALPAAGVGTATLATSKAMQYIAIFDGGSTQLYFTFRDTGKLLRAPAKYLVDMNRPLLRALQELLGKDNVAYFGPKP